ncbi:MBL fold metallo-hydrolase [Methanocaldococcus sp.]
MIKIVIDNRTEGKFLAQHGLSILIKDDKRILFDAGQDGRVLEYNLKLMGEVEKFDYFILSHGHYDHSDGLKFLIENELIDRVVIHKDALKERYYKNRYIGVSEEVKKLLDKVDVIFIKNKFKIDKNNMVLGEIERNFYYESDISEGKKDLVEDEIIFITNNKLITGCSHSGIINVVEYAKKYFDINFVIGGFHLINSSEKYINEVYNYFRSNNIKLAPLHCTGFRALTKLSNLPNFIYSYSGWAIE